MNGEVCCILGVCCPPGSAAQSRALAKWMESKWQLPSGEATKYAEDLLAVADLGPKGLVAPLLRAAADIAKHGKP